MDESNQLYDGRGYDHCGVFLDGFLSQNALARPLDLVSIDHASNNCSFGISFIQHCRRIDSKALYEFVGLNVSL